MPPGSRAILFIMSAKKRKPLPPCPDPDKYILVNSKEGPHWRKKRGTVTTARLNTVFEKNVDNSKVASPAAKRIVQKLRPFIQELNTGRLTAKLAGALIKAINEYGEPDFFFLNGFEFQFPPLGKLLYKQVTVRQNGDEIVISIPIDPCTMAPMNKLVTDYYFEAVLLYGDVRKENGLRIDSVISPLYPIKNTIETICELSLQLPATPFPWMILLKASCQEENRPSIHYDHYGMRVVMVGGGNAN
jgi:hypothetical protein